MARSKEINIKKENMNLPNLIDLTPEGKLVERANMGEEGYAENVEYNLIISVSNYITHIEYYGEDDTYLEEEQIQEIIKSRL
jgi:hypothetical protein